MTPERSLPVYPDSTIQRFWSKVNQWLFDDCWEYPAPYDNYGTFYVRGSEIKGQTKGEQWSAHRFAYTITFGPIPKGVFVCHSCDNKRCVNPDHLWLGNHQDNVADAVVKGKYIRRKLHKSLVPKRYLRDPFIVR